MDATAAAPGRELRYSARFYTVSSMIEKRSPDSAEQRERIDVYLGRSGLSALQPAHRAADRRRLRPALLPDPRRAHGAAVRAGAARGGVRRRHAAVRERRAAARTHAGADSDRSSAMPTTSACSRSRISATSRCRRTSARRRRRSTAALYRQAVALIATHADARRRARVAGVPALPDRVRRREAHLGDGLLHQALHRGLSRRGDLAGRARGAARGVRRDHRGAGRRAAGALPSRLSQPQPDVPPGPALHHRLPGRADGARHLRPGVAAARFLRRSPGADGQRADRLLPGAQGRDRRRKRRSASASI